MNHFQKSKAGFHWREKTMAVFHVVLTSLSTTHKPRVAVTLLRKPNHEGTNNA
jgi:hypothetical protein